MNTNSNFQLSNISPVKNVSVDELIYIKMGEFKPMYVRPYTATVQQSALETLANKMLSGGKPLATSSSLSGLTSGLISPSTVPILTLDAEWVGEQRYLFWLKATVEDNFNIVHKYYIQGYTDHAGVTATGVGNARMEHTINTVIETIVLSNATPFGVVEQEKLDRIYNVTHGNHWGTEIYLQRPSDIYNNLHTNEYTQDLGKYGSFESISTENTSLTVRTSDVVNKTSNVTNNIPVMFLQDVINAGINSSNELNFMSGNATEQSLATNAINRFNDPDIKNNQFLRILGHVNGSRRYGVFSLGELIRLDPSIDHRFKLFDITKQFADVTTASTPNVGENWDGQDGTTLSAYSIIEASVGLSTKYGFSKLHFTCSNAFDATGTPYVVISYYKSLINLDDMQYSQLLELFKAAFISNVFMDQTNNNATNLTVHMYVDLFGTSKLSIVDSYGRDTWFTIPTFANSSFSPILTIDKGNLDHMGNQVNGIVDWLGSNLSRGF